MESKCVFSAKGAALTGSLGSAPGNSTFPKRSAEGAIQSY